MNKEFADNLIKQMEQDYDAIADHFSQTRQAPWPEFDIIEKLVNPVASIHELKLLDIGCGSGRLSEIQKNIAGCTYTGIDLSNELLELGRKQYPDVNFIHGSMLELPFKDNSFDFITAIASLQHIPSRQYQIQALQEMARVAKTSATLFMTNWNLYQDVMPDYFTSAKKAFGDEWEEGDTLVPWKDKYGKIQATRYYHSFKEKEMAELLETSGWNIQEQYYMARSKRTNSAKGFNLVTIAKNHKNKIDST